MIPDHWLEELGVDVSKQWHGDFERAIVLQELLPLPFLTSYHVGGHGAVLPHSAVHTTNIACRPFASYTTTQSHTAPNSGPTSSASATSSTQAPTHA